MGIIDFIGVAFAGSKEEQSKIIVDYARRMGGVPQASIIGSRLKTSPYLAALVNGTIGHSLDYDDVAISLIGHPSVFLVPAILAIAEWKGSSQQDVLDAYVIGYETACCIAKPILQSHYVQGWHSTATFGTLGATAAVASLLKLNVNQIKTALGIGASLASGLRQNFGTMTKPLHAGMAAANGVQAALLAEAGFTADTAIIEAPLGFARVFGHNGKVDWTKASHNLGKKYVISSGEGLSIKPYPSCQFTHCAIDAVLDIKREQKMKTSEFDEIELGVSPFDKQILIHHLPMTGLEGKFSLEYCVARALLSGEVRLMHFSDSAVNQSQIKSLLGKMNWVEKFPMPVMGTSKGFGTKSITLKLKNGMTYSKEITFAKGMPQNPLTSDEFNHKFADCVGSVINKKAAEKSLAILIGIGKAEHSAASCGKYLAPIFDLHVS